MYINKCVGAINGSGKLFCLFYFCDLFERGYARVAMSARDIRHFPKGRLEAVLEASQYNCDIICQDHNPPFLFFLDMFCTKLISN
jgi:hypothetical protein